MTSMCRVHGSTDDLKIAYTQRLLPSYTLSVERNRHRIEIDEEETAKLDAAAGYGDMDTTGAALDCVGLIERRFGQEGWTTRDIDDAFLQPKLQASLLSYRSSRDEYTYRYINSTPSDCEHSCAPWNDTHALKGTATFRKSHAMELESRRTASTQRPNPPLGMGGPGMPGGPQGASLPAKSEELPLKPATSILFIR
jgi:hypothetical protein